MVNKIIPAVCLLLFINGCDNKRVFEKNTEIANAVWDSENIISYDVPVMDTVQAHDVFLNIRNSGKYKYSNLFVFITTHAPNGNILTDTLEIPLADRHGKWLGRGIGDIWTHQVPYKTNIRFPYRGIYTFGIQQAMRTEHLHEIYDIGLRVARAK